jgi:hypothetical protein
MDLKNERWKTKRSEYFTGKGHLHGEKLSLGIVEL